MTAQHRLDAWRARQAPQGNPGWYPDASGTLRWWDGSQWTGYSYGSGPPPGYPYRSRTSGLAIASFVMSLLWLFGIGSLLAVIFSFGARRNIKESRDHLGGQGLAVAGLVIGIIGLFGTALVFAVDLVAPGNVDKLNTAPTPVVTSPTTSLPPSQMPIHSSVGTLPPVSAPDATNLALGQTVLIPPGRQLDGIASVVLYSFTAPVQSQVAYVKPDVGKQFGVADVKVCAGPTGSQVGGNIPLAISFPDGQSLPTLLLGIRMPALSDVQSLAPNQCAEGYAPFEFTIGSSPNTVQFDLGEYQWSLNKAG